MRRVNNVVSYLYVSNLFERNKAQVLFITVYFNKTLKSLNNMTRNNANKKLYLSGKGLLKVTVDDGGGKLAIVWGIEMSQYS